MFYYLNIKPHNGIRRWPPNRPVPKVKTLCPFKSQHFTWRPSLKSLSGISNTQIMTTPPGIFQPMRLCSHKSQEHRENRYSIERTREQCKHCRMNLNHVPRIGIRYEGVKEPNSLREKAVSGYKSM